MTPGDRDQSPASPSVRNGNDAILRELGRAWVWIQVWSWKIFKTIFTYFTRNCCSNPVFHENRPPCVLQGQDPAHISCDMRHFEHLNGCVKKWEPNTQFEVSISSRYIEFSLNPETRLGFGGVPKCCHKPDSYKAATFVGIVKDLQEMCQVIEARNFNRDTSVSWIF